jgi:signal transduction histidine kinase
MVDIDQCTQNDGSWSPEFTLLKFTVLPPWWQQSWFILLCAAIIILFIIYIIKAHDRQLKRKYKEQERTIYKEKVKALININHELRTPLVSLFWAPMMPPCISTSCLAYDKPIPLP